MGFDDLVERMDRAALSAFGERVPVVYTPTVGSPPPAAKPLTAIFSEPGVLAKGDADAGVEAVGPSVFLRLSDLPTDPEVDEPTITIRGALYRVVARNPDGLGGIALDLRKVT